MELNFKDTPYTPPLNKEQCQPAMFGGGVVKSDTTRHPHTPRVAIADGREASC